MTYIQTGGLANSLMVVFHPSDVGRVLVLNDPPARDCKEQLPVDYARVFAFENFRRAARRAAENAVELAAGPEPLVPFPLDKRIFDAGATESAAAALAPSEPLPPPSQPLQPPPPPPDNIRGVRDKTAQVKSRKV